jgi:hypothetical protein
MANKHPIAKIHIGKFEGTLNASNTPVIIAEPSKTVGFLFMMYFMMRYSNPTQNITEKSVIRSASNLKTYNAIKNAGINAMRT